MPGPVTPAPRRSRARAPAVITLVASRRTEICTAVTVTVVLARASSRWLALVLSRHLLLALRGPHPRRESARAAPCAAPGPRVRAAAPGPRCADTRGAARSLARYSRDPHPARTLRAPRACRARGTRR